ncbi:hypothetical protein [Salisediminibacterium halotolerans]|uniref:Uncharacterized protein n=1 Tax=Salisediminibacterium halotolerans TaxID=517425 RepID=A0A1H9S9M0_9BACI|nr:MULTISPECIES: hypothetical protein [Salisediminibacterium]RLJ78118.1 hypothetical protein BCL39_0585 [Actinophytocola xinjiangensis]RPE88543.1 hypothetical protein EDD67_0874 [Salisediminibacterium halotolerans]TWG37095.1 hypothetical protein BCL52_0584 [Salisediminibacterium halotolerans]SER81692.1 hypothetical protein SAMN05444126_106108 [Salisediminibacterium haloalkalitolerans]GEL09252.1 hypothetical protein SHA02_26680 [Salisediminibacterium halotolerans]
MSGVIELVEIPEPDPDADLQLIEAENIDKNVYIETDYKWVFRKNMKVELTDNPVVFRLKSAEETMKPRMKFKKLEIDSNPYVY